MQEALFLAELLSFAKVKLNFSDRPTPGGGHISPAPSPRPRGRTIRAIVGNEVSPFEDTPPLCSIAIFRV